MEQLASGTTQRSPFRYFKTSPEIIRLAGKMCIRFPLLLRYEEDLPHERCIDNCHETVRFWRHWTGQHRPSLVEAKMRCLKLPGERIMSRDFDRQVAELQIRVAMWSRFSALETPLTRRTA